jgi:hypothetical protein
VGKKLLLKSWVVVASLLSVAVFAEAHTTYTGYSGAPGSRGQCAYDCHAQYDFAPTITVTGFPPTYTPGQQYTVAIAHSGGSSIAGFNASTRRGIGSTNGGTIAAGTMTSVYNITQETNGVHFTSANQNSGTFLWTAPPAGAGDVRLYWAGLQGNLTTGADTQIVLISQEGANGDRAPVIAAIPPQTVAENAHLGVRVTSTDPDGDAVSLSAQQLPTNSSFHDSTGGIGGFIFDPSYSQSGAYQVRIIAQSNALSDTEFISINVTNVDRKPVLAAIAPQSVVEGAHLGIRISATDPDNDPVSLSGEQLPVNATFHDSTAGLGGLVFDPDTTQAGQYQVRIIASSNSLADTQIVNITVIDLVVGTCSYTIGDVNNSNSFNGVDVVYSVGYFKGGPAPIYSCVCGTHGSFYVTGDVNASCNFNGVDVTYMVGYFKGGPMPHPCPDCPPARR